MREYPREVFRPAMDALLAAYAAYDVCSEFTERGDYKASDRWDKIGDQRYLEFLKLCFPVEHLKAYCFKVYSRYRLLQAANGLVASENGNSEGVQS